MIRLWIRANDRERLAKLCDIPLKVAYRDVLMHDSENDDILVGVLKNEGVLGRFGKRFVLGKKGVWLSNYGKTRREHVIIRGNTAYPDKIVFTPHSRIDVRFHKGGKAVDQTTNLYRVELMGEGSLPVRTFMTYYGSDAEVAKPKEIDKHLLLYSARRAQALASARESPRLAGITR